MKLISLRLVPCYEPPPAQQKYQTEFCLGKRGGIFSIGYGSGGVAPLAFRMGKDQDGEVGYFKLFLSTKPLDLSSIPQGSPFTNSRRAMKTYERKSSELWDDILIPLVLRRREAGTANRTVQHPPPRNSNERTPYSATLPTVTVPARTSPAHAVSGARKFS